MATSVVNISNVSLTVSGNTTKSATISWTLPSIPSGSTISSCTLTGTATANMSKGNATIKVNGTTVSSGSSFTINLGTSNTTSSVTATAVGGNKNASGTVTFSDLTYTVTYTEPLVTYTVTFVDWDSTVLKTESVTSGSSATAPSDPSREGYKFTGWDNDFSNVTSNLTVTAQYIVWDTLIIKDGGSWADIGRVFRKVNSVWIEENNEDWVNLFNTNTDYRRKEIPIPTAILYEDGTFIFSPDTRVDNTHGSIIASYVGWDTDVYTSSNYIPWYNYLTTHIQYIYLNNITAKTAWSWFGGGTDGVETLVKNVYCNGFNGITNTAFMFDRSPSLISIVFNNFNTSNVTTMRCMFQLCSSLISLNLSNFDVNNVTNMGHMFSNCSSLASLDLSNFDTSNVTDMQGMFHSCSSLTSLDINNFDTNNVTNMYAMFYSCSSLTSLDLSSFDTSNVTNMQGMFQSCSSLTSLDVSSFDTSNVTNMYAMFYSCSSLTSLDLSSFDMNNVTNTDFMFGSCTNLKTIYVKDQTAKTKIESSSNFPSTATVIIGSPA